MGAVEDRPRVDIDIRPHALVEPRIGADLDHRSDGIADAGPPPGGETDDLAARGEMIRRPPRSTLFPYTSLPISVVAVSFKNFRIKKCEKRICYNKKIFF